MSDSGEKIYLAKFLSVNGAASRRRAAELVRAGRVAVNGVTVDNPADPVPPAAEVRLDGRVVAPLGRRHYVMLNKPRGYVCTNEDIHAARKALDLIALPGVRLVSAGRLDKESDGLLLFSDDGDFIYRVAHPKFEILKVYEVATGRPLPDRALRRLRDGIVDAGEFLQPHSLEPVGPAVYRVVLNEGRKREIRRLIAAAGGKVVRLTRLSVGHLTLGGLPAGCWRELSSREVEEALRPGLPELGRSDRVAES